MSMPTQASSALEKKHGELLPATTLDAIKRNGITLKGPLYDPSWRWFSPRSTSPCRKQFGLLCQCPSGSIASKATKARYDENIDIITVRENTEGMYSGLGQTTKEDGSEAEAMSRVTRSGC